jgi:hypothetical protein
MEPIERHGVCRGERHGTSRRHLYQDDNMTQGALVALHRLGLRMGQDIQVVRWPTPARKYSSATKTI